jgi:XTP/dITP diphosphohydrolase
VPRPRLVLLRTSPRVAPDLLTLSAWDALRTGPVFGDDPALPLARAIQDGGIAVAFVDDPAAALVAAQEHGQAVWLCDPVSAVVLEVTDDLDLEVVPLVGSHDVPGGQLLEAVAVMDRLRSPGGCPWDAEQTHVSLAPYLLEEAYEAYQALEDGSVDTDLREELGDVLLQVLFHARLAQERTETGWDIDDLAADLVDKLVRRHPHVFGDVTVDGVGAVEANWDAIKTAEKQRTSVTDGVALGQPALSLAAKLVGRAQKAGLPTSLGEAELGEDPGNEELLGRALFGLAARARISGIDPEAALRRVARSYLAALQAAEQA